MAAPGDAFSFPRTGTTMRNRAVLAAMTNKQSHPDGTLSDAEINWLLRRAEGGFGIVTTAASHVTPGGQGWVRRLSLASARRRSRMLITMPEAKTPISAISVIAPM